MWSHWNSLLRTSTGFLIILLVHGLGGCSDGRPALVPVTGRVLMNGTGVTAGAVYFHPDAANSFLKDTPSGQLRLDGSFTMKTFPYGEGIPPGKYKVTLVPELASRIQHTEYGTVETTPWVIEVPEAGLEPCELEIR